jgi:hypothetical protein
VGGYVILGIHVSEIVFWAGVPTLATLLVSLIAGWVLYQRGQHIREPRYAVEGRAVIREVGTSLDQLEVWYADTRVPQLSSARYAIGNAGRGTIRAEDVASVDQVVVVLPDGAQALKAQVVWATDETNRFSVQVSDDLARVHVKFEYMDRSQGAIVEILHSGPPEVPALRGTIKGAGRFVETPGRKMPSLTETLVPLGGLVFALGSGIPVMRTALSDKHLWSAVVMGVLFLLVAAYCVLSFIHSARARRDAIPRLLAKHLV